MGREIIYAREIINTIPSPTDIDIMKYIKDSEEETEDISFIELKEMVNKLQKIDAKKEKEIIIMESIQEDCELEELEKELEELTNEQYNIEDYKYSEEYDIEDSYETEEEDYKPLKFITGKDVSKMQKIEDSTIKLINTVKNKVNSIDKSKILNTTKEVGKSLIVVISKMVKQISKYEPKTYKMVLMYKKKVQKELEFSEKTLNKKGVSQEEMDRAEKTVNKLKNKNKFNDHLYPALTISQMMFISLKFTMYDFRGMAMFLIINGCVISKYMKSYQYIDVAQNVIFSGLFANAVFSFVYAIITFRSIRDLIQQNNLKDFMWKEFPRGQGIETEFYSIFNGKVERDTERERVRPSVEDYGFDLPRERVRPNRDDDNDDDCEGKYKNALALWSEKHFKEGFMRALPIKEKDKNEYITKFSFRVPLELELAVVEKKIPEYARYSGKTILHNEISIKESIITLFIEEKELPSMVNFDDDKIDRSSDTKVYIGEAFDGSVYLDFDSNPHMLIGGSTGCGKGVTQNIILTQLTQKGEVIIMDLSTKAGADYSYYRDKGYRIVTQLEETLDFFKGLQDEARIRMEIFRSKGKNKLSAYNKTVSEEEKIYRKFIIIDEYASLKRVDSEDKEEAKEIENAIISLGEQARAVGIHIIIATQNAKATIINTELRNNLMLRVVGRCSDFNASNVFLENDLASIKRTPPLIKSYDTGRFVVSGASSKNRLAMDGHFTVQVPYVEFAGDHAEEHIKKYGHLVELPKKSKIIDNYKKDHTLVAVKEVEVEEEVIVKIKEKVIPIINKKEVLKEIELEEEIEETDIYNVFEEKKPDKEDLEDLFN